MLMEVVIGGWQVRPEVNDSDSISSSLVGQADTAANCRNNVVLL
jgi:hypothetical protein